MDREAVSCSLPYAGSFYKIDKETRQSLFRTVERKHFVLFLSFIQARAEIFDDFHGSFWIARQHVKIGLLAEAQHTDLSHRLGATGMRCAVEHRRFATEEIPRH